MCKDAKDETVKNSEEELDMVNKLNIGKIKTNSQKVMSTKESLKDVVPIDWSEEVLNGKVRAKVK